MYFDHCETPAELRKAINEFMKMQTGRRVSFGEGTPKSVFVPLVDEHTDQTLREGYAEAQAVATKMQRADPHLPSVPEPSVVPLEGLALIGRWCADAERVKTDPKGAREAMYFERCDSPRALREAIREFLTDPEKFAARYLMLRFTMGSLHTDRAWCKAVAGDCHRDASMKAIELWEQDPRLPRPPVEATDPEAGLRRIMLWCVEAERATGTPGKDIDRQDQEPGDELSAGYHLDKPESIDQQLWLHLVHLVKAFAAGVDVVTDYLQYWQGKATDGETQWSLIQGGEDNARTYWAAAGPFQTIPDGWPVADGPLEFCGADGDSALETVVSFTRMICGNKKDIAARAAKGQTGEMAEVEAKRLVRRLNREVHTHFTKSPREDRNPRKREMKNRFTFNPGQVLFDEKDLGLPSGEPVTMLKKLVASFGCVVPYTDFDNHYSSATPGTVHKSKRAIVESFTTHKVPCTVKSKTGEGYVISEGAPIAKRKKRVRKR